ncbi:hypothetical protein ACJDU8_04425 [Clostridium sp. WILCCON 0269]|uniref:BIG2 domain-containing protein n=1 Tax=Candidatus Clostridium eludens TaxID=3381663 RepID=A0ABW8SHK6_9CLOT
MNKIDKFWNFFKFEKGEPVKINNMDNTAVISSASENQDYYDDLYIRTDANIQTGDIVEYENKKWFVISQENKESISYKAKIRRSNYRIKVVIDGVLNEFDSIIEIVSVSIGGNGVINIAAGEVTVTIPMDTISNKIDVNSRFVKLGYVWKVSGVDRSRNGLNIIHAEKDSIGANDDMENEIANKNLIDVWRITVNDENRTVNIDSDYTYTAVVLKNGSEYTGASLIWRSSDENIAVVSNGVVHPVALGKVTISVYMESNPNVKLDLDIEVDEEPDTVTYKMYEAETDGTDKNYNSFSIIEDYAMMFGMEKYINGVLAPNDTYTFTLDSNGVPSANYAYTVLNNYSVKIENKSMSTPKLVLTAVSNESGGTITQDIQLKGEW